MSNRTPKRPATVVSLALPILCVAFAIRAWHLATQSFWWDEAYSAMVASKGLREIVSTLAREDYHPPLHYFVLHFWMRVAGQSEFALRFVSVSAGVLTVAAAWTAARRLLTRSAAPIAALIFALAPFLWYYSQEARMFALVPLFGTLALYFCARAVEENRRWLWAPYTAMVTLGLYDFYYAIFLPFVCGVWIVLRAAWTWERSPRSTATLDGPESKPPAGPVVALASDAPRAIPGRGSKEQWGSILRDWAIATLAAFVLYAPWLPIFLSRTDVWSSAFTPDNGPAKVIVWTWPELILGLPSLPLYRQPLPAALLALAAAITLVSLAHSWRVRAGQPAALLAALAFVIPYLTIAAISAIKPVYHPRYAIPIVVGLYLTLAGLIDSLVHDRVRLSVPGLTPRPDRWRHRLVSFSALSPSPRPAVATGKGTRIADAPRAWMAGSPERGLTRASRWLGLASCLVLVACSSYGLSHLAGDSAYARDDYRDAIRYVEQNERPGDTILHNAIPPFWYYYHGASPSTYFPTGPYTEQNVASELNQVTRGHGRLWYVQHAAIPNDPSGFVDAQLRLHAVRLDERWFGAIRVQLWQVSPGEVFAATKFLPASANVANQLMLTGYAASGEAIGGHTIDVELRWQVSRTPSSDDGFWVALGDSDGWTWGRADTRPRDAAYRLSGAWPAGETVVTRFDLPIDIGTPPNHYQLIAGVYRLSDLTGLDVLDAGQHPIGQQIVLGPLNVPKPSVGTTDPSLPNQVEMQVLPALTLVADRLGSSDLAPGDQVPVTFLWRASGSLPLLRGSLLLQAPGGQIIAEDTRPIGDSFPTDRWEPGNLIREQRLLKVPASAPSGPASLSLALAGGPSIPLGTATIRRIVREFTPPPTSHPLQAVLGEAIALVGYDLSADQARPGDQLTITLTWKDLRTVSTSYHVFVHLLDDQNHIWAQWDGVPRNWSYPTSAWVPGEYIVDRYTLTLSPQAPAGSLSIEVGLYDLASGKRLAVTGPSGDPEADRIVLQTLRVAR